MNEEQAIKIISKCLIEKRVISQAEKELLKQAIDNCKTPQELFLLLASIMMENR